MSDPTIDAARDVLAESLDKIRRGIAGLTVDQLNAKPAGGETNSVAVIATHALASTRSYMSIAVGAPPPPRDRPAEFRTVAADGFGGWVEDMIGQCLGLLEGVTFDPSGSRMYFASQRAFGRGEQPGPGAIYEVSGPFRGSRAFHAAGNNA